MLQQASASSLRLKLIADDYSQLACSGRKTTPELGRARMRIVAAPRIMSAGNACQYKLLPHANRQYGAPQQQLRILAKAAHISKHLDNLNDSDNVITLKRVS